MSAGSRRQSEQRNARSTQSDSKTPIDFFAALQEVAIRAAKTAGEIQKSHFRSPLQIAEKRLHDVKLAVELSCEEAILNTIRASFPDHSIITEETGVYMKTGCYQWIIDPLDGTLNFYHALPYFCTSLSCYAIPAGNAAEKPLPGFSGLDEPLLGVIYSPLLDELFVGIHGQGSTRNGQRISVKIVPDLSESMVSLSFGSTEDTMNFMGEVLKTLVCKTRKVRCLGSTALDLVHVADGGLSALIQRGVKSWDFAAARIILEEAGGVFEAVQYASNLWEVIGCAPGLYEQLKGIMRGDEAREPQ